MSNYQEILAEINLKYDVSIDSASSINRFDIGNSNILLKLEGNNQSYFYKSLPTHSLRDGLNQIYGEFSLIQPHSFKMALPIRSKNNTYCEKIGGNLSSIYPFIEHKVFNESNIPVDQIFTCLTEFHDLIRKLDIPFHPFKTYENWFERGPKQLKIRIKEHKFLRLFEDFIDGRFKSFKFISGNAHFDLNPFNVLLTSDNEIYFSDFDNAQPAALAKDYFDIMSRYLTIENGLATISKVDLDNIIFKANEYVDGLQKWDAKYLLVRPKLGPLFDENNGLREEQIKVILNGLLEFISN